MISATSTGTELRRFGRGHLPRAAVGALILIPLLYGALYLWAFWDPTGHMDHLPVALVNQDVAVERDGGPLAAGDQVVDALVDSGDLDWREVSAADAQAGVADGTYYFAVTVPEDFSATVAGVGGDDPQAAQLQVTYNDANSFLASTLGRSAMAVIESAVREQIGSAAVDTMLVGLGSARDGFATATDGALTLTAAAGRLDDGASSLADGAGTAADGAGALATGLHTLLDGVGTASDAVASLDDGTAALESGAGTLATGASGLAQGTRTLAKGASSLRSGSTQLASGASSLADGTQSLKDGTASVATGAASLDTGAASLAGAARTASEGATTLATGAATLQSGTQQLADGARTLATGLATAQPTVAGLPDQLSGVASLLGANTAMLRSLDPGEGDAAVQGLIATNTRTLATLGDLDAAGLVARFDAAVAGAAQLDAQLHPGSATSPTVRDGVDQVAAGASSLRDGLAQLSAGADTLATGASTLSAGASSAAAGAGTVATGASTLADAGAKVATGARSLASGARSAASGAGKVAAGATTLDTNLGTLSDGTSALRSGTHSLAAGASDAASGADALASGTATLSDGATRLADGTGRLADGAQTLADGLGTGAQAIPDDSPELRAQRADTVAAPVSVTDTAVARAEGFGEGFAPFFLSLALFVGALITWLMLRPVPTRALAAPVSGWRIAIMGYLPGLLVGVAQAVVTVAVVGLGLGLDMATVPGTVAFTILVAAAFFALQQALVAILGPAVGKVAILALLMLQLASSGGTYPVETTGRFFQAIHPFLPMTYTVQGLRQVITGGADGRLVTSTVVLLGVLLGSLAVTAWRTGRMRTWTLDRLHPAISL